MTEKEYRLAHFEENLAPYRGRKIVLYGTGANARALLERFDAAFSFDGVIAPDGVPVPGVQDAAAFGKPVLTLAQALQRRPDIILIAAQMYGAETVYQRIHAACRAHGVLLLDMYGTDLCAVHDELEGQGFLDLAGWRACTAPYGTVSFELQDTVLVQDLLQTRRPTVRPVMGRLIGELAATGKTVLLIAAPDLDAVRCREALERAGLHLTEDGGAVRLLVRDEKERFFRDVKAALPGKRLLHIGSRLLEDGIMPRLCGVDSRRMVFYDPRSLTAFETKQTVKTAAAGADRAAVLRQIDDADVVSFDLFDTLLVRCVPSPADVFALTAYRADCLKGSADLRERFYAVRLQEQCGEKTLPQIYSEVAERLGLSPEAAQELQRLERQTELEVISLRIPAAGLVRYAKEKGKRVVLCSDMYCTGAELAALLKENGLEGFDRLIVSCEYGLCKADGLFEEVKKAAGSLCEAAALRTGNGGSDAAGTPKKGAHGRGIRILHIGDSIAADQEPAKRAGLRSIRLPSVWDCARTAGFLPPGAEDAADRTMQRDAAAKACTDAGQKLPARAVLAARSLYGLWAAARFADPFAEEENKMTREDRLNTWGKVSFAPVLTGFLLHLLAAFAADKPERVLFAARDGWLLRQWYETARWAALPRSDYFYTSRHAALLPFADRPELAGYLADMTAGLTGKEMMRAIFDREAGGAPADDAPRRENGTAEAPETDVAETAAPERKTAVFARPADGGDAAKARRYRYLLEQRPALAVLAKDAAACQRACWDRLGLAAGMRCAYVDFVATGTSQRLTEEAAPFFLRGYYVGRPANGTEPACDVCAWLDGKTEAERLFLDRYMETEYYMTSAEPSLRRFAPDGSPVFAPEVRSAADLAEIRLVHRAASEVFERFLALADWEQTVRQAEEPAAFVRELSACLEPEQLCGMALSGACFAVKRHYYDDWSQRWIDEGT